MLSLAFPLALAACGLPPVATAPSALALAAAPAYGRGFTGAIVPVACAGPPLGGFGALPPGCARDLALGAQAVDPHDLLRPRHPGPPLSDPSARAAYVYIYGTESPVAPAGGAVAGTPIVVQTLPPAGAGAVAPIEGATTRLPQAPGPDP